MKHLELISKEFAKLAVSSYDISSYEGQHRYLDKHQKSKKEVTKEPTKNPKKYKSTKVRKPAKQFKTRQKRSVKPQKPVSLPQTDKGKIKPIYKKLKRQKGRTTQRPYDYHPHKYDPRKPLEGTKPRKPLERHD